MKYRSRGHRLLPMANAALVDPRTCLQPPSRSPAAAGTHKTVGSTKLGQVHDASLLRPEARRKLQKPQPSDPPSADPGYATQRSDGRQNI
jgi:hypothetical protein